MLTRRFTGEQRLFRLACRRFLAREIAPHMARWRAVGRVDREAFRRAGEAGLLCFWAAPELGGAGLADFRFDQVLIEETQSALCGDWGVALHNRVAGGYLERLATPAQQSRFLPGCVAGTTILALALTEPQAGSDLSALETRARPAAGGHFLLDGRKTYISHGAIADLFVVAARTDSNDPRRLGLFLVEGDRPGLARGRPLAKLGRHAQDTCELFFDGVRVPAENLLGELHRGLEYIKELLPLERLVAAVEALAAAWKALALTVDFARERRLFGRALADFQNTRFRLASLRASLSAAQVFVDACVAAFNDGRLGDAEAAEAKLLATELLCQTVDEGVQLHGGAGYLAESPICQLYADARVTRIFAGSSEVLKERIARNLFATQPFPFVETET